MAEDRDMENLNVTVGLSAEWSGWSRTDDRPPAVNVVASADETDGAVAIYLRVMEAEGNMSAWAHLTPEQAVVLGTALIQGAEVARRIARGADAC